MIFDNIKNAKLYFALHPNFKRAFEFLNSAEFDKDGRIEIDENMYVNVQTYKTKEPQTCDFEAHNDYIDIQYIIEGKERIGCAKRDCTTDKISYDKEHDVVFLEAFKENSMELEKGDFVIFFPTDAHKPCLNAVSCALVKKAVVKVKII